MRDADASISLRSVRVSQRCRLAALLCPCRHDSLQNAVAEGDTRTHLVPSRPHQRRHHRHLQAQRPLRRGGAEEAQLVPARLAQRRSRRRWTRTCSTSCGRSIARSAPRSRSRSSAAIARPPPTRCCAGALSGVAQTQPAHAGQGDRLLHPRRAAGGNPRCRPAPAARRRRLLSDLRLAVRASGRRQRAPLAAHDARPARQACSRTAAPCMSRPTASRCRAMRWRSPMSRRAAARRPPVVAYAARDAGMTTDDQDAPQPAGVAPASRTSAEVLPSRLGRSAPRPSQPSADHAEPRQARRHRALRRKPRHHPRCSGGAPTARAADRAEAVDRADDRKLARRGANRRRSDPARPAAIVVR